jgi:hypothetical protein
MASTKVYICDKCESYVNEKELHRVTISIAGAPGYNSSRKAVTTLNTYNNPGSLTRDICHTCAQRLVESLSLDKSENTLTRELADNFNANVLNQPNVEEPAAVVEEHETAELTCSWCGHIRSEHRFGTCNHDCRCGGVFQTPIEALA